MKVHYSTPYGLDGNIGGAYNEYVSTLPINDWVCLRDGDTMFLTPEWGRHIQQIAENAQDAAYSLVGCFTNRLHQQHQVLPGMNDPELSMLHHHDVAMQLEKSDWGTIEQCNHVLAAFFWLMPVWLIKANPLPENDAHFDSKYCMYIHKKGHRLAMAHGLYVYHMYRPWSSNPGYDYQHLIKNK